MEQCHQITAAIHKRYSLSTQTMRHKTSEYEWVRKIERKNKRKKKQAVESLLQASIFKCSISNYWVSYFLQIKSNNYSHKHRPIFFIFFGTHFLSFFIFLRWRIVVLLWCQFCLLNSRRHQKYVRKKSCTVSHIHWASE